MKPLYISIERKGKMVRVGTIKGSGPHDACFQYLDDYLSDPLAAAVSVSLPLRQEPYSPSQTAAFFEGLLPEGFTRRAVSQWMRVDEGDYLSILHGLGRECLGALCVAEEGELSEASYEEISSEQISALAAEGAVKSAELVSKSHLSLAGASGKVGLYYDRSRDRWYLPKGTAPSTHIVKQSHVRLDSIVANEQLALRTAFRCGISAVHSFIINTGGGGEQDVLFASERYDRIIPEDPKTVCGLPRPFRLHQEDFAQAMGIPASRKYEAAAGCYMKAMFDILRQYSADPIADQLKLWDIIVFNCLIGNADAHIKNYSLCYNMDLGGLRLAPAYDLVSTAVYEQSTRNMAFSIGGVYSLDEIDKDVFMRAASEAGLGKKLAMQRLAMMAEQFIPALELSAEELSDSGFVKAAELKQRILSGAGRNLSSVLLKEK